MALKYREEIVGKRFLSVRSATKLKTSKLSEWEWRSGVVRAVTHKDVHNPDFMVLVEFDDCEWKRREWIRVLEIFQVFMVEFTLVWAPREHKTTENGESKVTTIPWPALSFKTITDKPGITNLKRKPVEYVGDREIRFLDDSEFRHYRVGKFQDDDITVQSPAKDEEGVRKAVRLWLEQQDGQRILLTTPSVLVGYRVEVYCAEGTRQWYTAVIQSYNDNTRELSVTDDTVLEVHNEDPSLVQMKLIGHGVVESILKGENLGITPRRRSCNIRQSQRDTDSSVARFTRNRSQSPSQSSPAGGKSGQNKGKGKKSSALTTTTSAHTTSTSSATSASNKDLPTNNPPDTAPQKDEKEKPPDKGKTRTSQRERKRRSDGVTPTPPAKQKPAADPPKEKEEKKLSKETTITRSTSVKAGSVLPPSTQPTVVVRPVKTPADSKIVKEKEGQREQTKSPRTAGPKSKKAKEADKSESPAAGVRSRTPQRKEKEKATEKISKETVSKQQTQSEKPERRKTRESTGKKGKKEAGKKEDESTSTSSKEGSKPPPSPASSTSSVSSTATTKSERPSRQGTPVRNLEASSRRTRGSPVSRVGQSESRKKDNNSSTSSRAATPISDRLQADSLVSVSESSPAGKTANPGSCSSSTDSQTAVVSTTNSTATTTVSTCTVETVVSRTCSGVKSPSPPCSIGEVVTTTTNTLTCISTTSVTATTVSSPSSTSISHTTNSPNASQTSSTLTTSTTTKDSPRLHRPSPQDSQSQQGLVGGEKVNECKIIGKKKKEESVEGGGGSGGGCSIAEDGNNKYVTSASTASSATSTLCVSPTTTPESRNKSHKKGSQLQQGQTSQTSQQQKSSSSSSLTSSSSVASLSTSISSSSSSAPSTATSATSAATTSISTTSLSTSSSTSSNSTHDTNSSSKNTALPPPPMSQSSKTSSYKLLPITSKSEPAACSSSSAFTSSPATNCSRPEDNGNMHFKKMILLHKKEVNPSSQETFTTDSGINVNHPLTDQIAKLSSVKGERTKSWNNNDHSSPLESKEIGQRRLGEGVRGGVEHYSGKIEGRIEDGASYGKPGEHVHPGAPHYHLPHRDALTRSDLVRRNEAERETFFLEMERERLALDERSLSRSSTASSSASLSRMEELRRTSGQTDGHGSSPLIFDKNEPVRVYRDPELLKKDEMRFIHPSSHSSGPATLTQGPTFQAASGLSAAQGHQGHPPPLASPHHAGSASQRTLMSPQLHYPSHLTSPLNSLSPHLPLPHHMASPAAAMDPNTLRTLSNLTPHQQAAFYMLTTGGQHVMPQYPLVNNIQTAQLEYLWQQKYPSLPVPPPWMLLQYQEELLRDRNIIALERERRDRELVHERERADRLERERSIERDRAKREAVERERAERERAERERKERERKQREEAERKRLESERAERERQERERAEKAERERKEQERIKQEREERGRILKESAEAAVNQHFTASLRLASKKQAAAAVPWPPGAPSITHGLPGKHPGMAVPPEALSLPAAHPHQSAFTHRPIPHQAPPRDHMKEEKVSDVRTEQPSPRPISHHDSMRSQQEALRNSEEKRQQTLQQEQMLRHQIMRDKHPSAHPEHHAKYPPGHPVPAHMDLKKHPVYGYPPPKTMVATPSSLSPPTTTGCTAVKQEPNFSLYGYQPFQHSYITKETLYSQGLKDDKQGLQLLKEEMKMAGRPLSPQQRKPGLVSPPPLIKDNKHGSVIVENKPKESELRREMHPHGLPPPAHSHHGGSITLGTVPSPRPQVKGQEVRPGSYGGHQPPHPGSSPHPGHMPPSHIHGLPPGHPASRGQSPLSLANPHYTTPSSSSSSVMQPMDLHKASPKDHHRDQAPPQQHPPPPPPHPHSRQSPHSHPVGYPPTVVQPPVSHTPPNTTAAHSYNLIQQGLVPNPIYSQSGAAQYPTKVLPPNAHQQHPGHIAQQQQQQQQHHPRPQQAVQHSPPIMPGQKRRSEQHESSGGPSIPTHHKKSRIAEAIAASGYTNNSPQQPAPQQTVQAVHPASSTMSSGVPGYSGGQAAVAGPPHPPPTSSPSSTSSSTMHSSRTAAAPPAPMSSTSSGFMDSFRTFVENAVQIAFNQDQEAAKTHPKGRHKTLSAQVMSGTPPTSTASPSPSPIPATSVSSQVVNRQQPPVNLPLSTTVTSHSPSPVLTSSAAASAPPQTGNMPPYGLMRPGPASTPGGASVSSSSSIVDTINRMANGFVESDSDTLSAPSPPPHRSEITPSPSCRPGNHKAFKKAWLQRYSDEDKEKENAKENNSNVLPQDPQQQPGQEGKSGEPVKDCYVNCSYISPTKEGGSKSPISILAKDFRKDEEDSTTSASETESHQQQNTDGSAKRRMKQARRHQAGSSASKKQKTEEDIKPAVQTSTGGKKRFSRKGREGVKDSTNKGSSDDEVVKDRKTEEEKSRQILHNQHHKQHQQPTVNVKSENNKSKTGEKESKTGEKNNQESEKDAETESNSSTSLSNSTTGKDSKDKKSQQNASDGESTPKENKKRGRKPRDKKDKDGPPPQNLSTILANKPLNKANMGKLKKTLEPFIQDSACPEIAPKLMKCRECKMTSNQRNKKIPNIFCRFYAFRRLRYNQKAMLAIAGFSEPSDADQDDIELWKPRMPMAEPKLDVSKAKYVIQHVGDQFCQLVEQEKEAMSWVSPDTKVAWKRAVQGVREMCDVCDTTLFNMHWVCHKCGFVVCIDCYRQRTRKSGGCIDSKCKTCDSEGQKWLTCSVNRQAHEPDKLMITQIIPSDALWVVGRMIHEVRDKWKIRANCPCGRSKDLLLPPKNGVSQLLSAAIKDNPDKDDHKPVVNGNSPTNGDDHKMYKNQTTNVNGSPPGSLSPLSLLANVASMDSENSRDKKILNKMKEAFELAGSGGHYNPLADGKEDDDKSAANCSTLRELLTKTAGRMKPNPENNKKAKTTLDDIIQQVVERNLPKDSDAPVQPLLKHYIPKNGSMLLSGRDSPIRCYTLKETTVLFPDVPHSWLDLGRLLRLSDPRNKGNLKMFQQQWRRGQPVLVSNCHKRMTRNLWLPETFAKEFGEIDNDLVNCRSGVVLIGHSMKQFWEGFESAKKRLKDENGKPMILKLKDWPPTEDFSEVLPGRFQDLMNGLPLPEYTHRNGIYNMASRLPDFFVKPDLGPKMYNAYGSALFPREGTTNLHLDVSDAVNTMVCVAVPKDDDVDHGAAALKAIDEAGCDPLTKARVLEGEEIPGALWHIFDPLDADKIRDILNKIAKERGETIEPHHDPIHDQSWYLDEMIRQRLLDEYNVQGYTILQCLGDAVFIPAGAPHQVRNLHSCIKVAEDFVSPENVSYCFKMTQEFRHLSDTHSNHEDKLQVKNIIYHTVKDAVAILREANP